MTNEFYVPIKQDEIPTWIEWEDWKNPFSCVQIAYDTTYNGHWKRVTTRNTIEFYIRRRAQPIEDLPNPWNN